MSSTPLSPSSPPPKSSPFLMTSPTIVDYYQHSYDESQRLSGTTNIERIRTLRLLHKYLPPAPSTILDIGGGTGVYAIPLAKSYRVHLIDPVPRHIEQAHSLALTQGVPLYCHLGDARNLMFPSQIADAVLLLGPMYHLQDPAERQLALRESHRVCVEGGVLFAAGMSRFATLCDGMKRGFLKDPQFVEIVRQDLATGRHVNTTNKPSYWTDAYLHRPEELKREVEEAGFVRVMVVAVEGPSWLVWGDEPGAAGVDEGLLKEVLQMLDVVEQETSLIGASPHFLVIGWKHKPPTSTSTSSSKTSKL